MASRKRGSIVSKGPDKWLVRAFVGRNAEGKKQYASRVVSGPYSEAQKALTSLHSEIDTGTYVGRSTELLEPYTRSWVAGKEIEPRTRRDYLLRLEYDIFSRFGQTKLQDLTRVELQEHFQTLAKPPRNLSARTRQYTYQVLKQALEQARKDGLIVKNPMQDVARPKLKRSGKVQKIQPLDDQQTASLLQASEGHKLHTLWLFLLTTGARPGEALGLEWRNVFLDDPQPHVMIEQALTTGEDNELEIRGTKNEGSVRRVTIPERTVRALRAHKVKQAKWKMQWKQRHDYVFPNGAGQLQDMARIRTRWKTACRKAGVPPVRLYDARHTHATWLLNRGVNPKVAAARLGHASTQMFLDVYTHVTKQEEDKAVGIMNEAFG